MSTTSCAGLWNMDYPNLLDLKQNIQENITTIKLEITERLHKQENYDFLLSTLASIEDKSEDFPTLIKLDTGEFVYVPKKAIQLMFESSGGNEGVITKMSHKQIVEKMTGLYEESIVDQQCYEMELEGLEEWLYSVDNVLKHKV